MARLAIVLTNGYADGECAYLYGVGSAHFGIETVIVAPGGNNIVSMGGLQTVPAADLSSVEAGAFDVLIICGGTIWETDTAPDLKQLAMGFLDAGKHVAAICGATLALADAGMLDGISHTSNSAAYLIGKSPKYNGVLHYLDKVTAIADRNVITAPGHAPVYFAAAIFRAVGVDEQMVRGFEDMAVAGHC